MSLAKLWAPRGTMSIFLPSLLLGAVAIWGWARVVGKVLPGPSFVRERGALVIAGAVNPGIVSTVLQPNVDLAVLTWGMWLLDGVASGRLTQTIVAGTLLCFSKETGVIVYCVGALVLWIGRAGQRNWIRDALILSVPIVIYAAAVFAPKLLVNGDAPTIWGVTNSGEMAMMRYFQPLNLWSRHLLNYVLLVTVLQFQWIASVALFVGLAALIRARGFARQDLFPRTAGRRVLLTAGLSYAALTTFRTYGNLRYFALFLPFLWLAAVVVARRAGVPGRMRTIAIALTIPCLMISARWSVDPISRAVFGSFSIGRDRMFDMTSISHDCCGHGMDPLAYNLQYAAFSAVLDRAMSDLRPSDTLNIVMTKEEWGGWFTPLDRLTSMRTIDDVHGIRPPIIAAESLAVGRPGPDHVWYLETPHMKDSSANIARFYRATGLVRTYDASGARVRLVEMRRLPGADWPSTPSWSSRYLKM